MNAETLEAIRGSIRKWEGILAGTMTDDGTENCPLCSVFFKQNEPLNWKPGQPIFVYSCDGCPVKEKTGEHRCVDSPYMDWAKYQNDMRRSYFHERVFDDRSRQLAEAELNFLRELLPEEAT